MVPLSEFDDSIDQKIKSVIFWGLRHENNLCSGTLQVCRTFALFISASLSMRNPIASQVSITMVGALVSISSFVMRSKRDPGSSSLASTNTCCSLLCSEDSAISTCLDFGKKLSIHG